MHFFVCQIIKRCIYTWRDFTAAMFELFGITSNHFSWSIVSPEAMAITILTRFLIEMCINVALKSSLARKQNH